VPPSSLPAVAGVASPSVPVARIARELGRCVPLALERLNVVAGASSMLKTTSESVLGPGCEYLALLLERCRRAHALALSLRLRAKDQTRHPRRLHRYQHSANPHQLSATLSSALRTRFLLVIGARRGGRPSSSARKVRPNIYAQKTMILMVRRCPESQQRVVRASSHDSDDAAEDPQRTPSKKRGRKPNANRHGSNQPGPRKLTPSVSARGLASVFLWFRKIGIRFRLWRRGTICRRRQRCCIEWEASS
jgi:hypothetical protein